MFNFIKSLFQKKHPTGLIPDPRPVSEKELDYLHEEIAGDVVPVYKVGMTNLNHYPEENQNFTSSCVAHGVTLGATKGSPRLSKMFTYRQRANFPLEGMWLQNAGEILKNTGACLYQTLPNTNLESEANNIVISDATKKEAADHKVTNYIQIQNPTIDKIASVINQGYPVAIIIYGSIKEWSKEFPTLEDNPTMANAAVRHCIAAVDAFTIGNTKYLKIQDSAWFGGYKVRYLSEDFIKARCYGAMYTITLEPATYPKPNHVFTYDIGQRDSGPEVVWLQKRLQYEGTFPKTQDCTGLFAGITLKAVKDYQTRYGIPSTGFVGPITRRRLNGW